MIYGSGATSLVTDLRFNPARKAGVLHYTMPMNYYDAFMGDEWNVDRGYGNGVGVEGFDLPLLAITDGTSQTILLGESAGAPFTYYKRRQLTPDNPAIDHWSIEAGYPSGPWASTSFGGTWATVGFDPDYIEVDNGIVSEKFIVLGGTPCVHNCTNSDHSPHSFHPGGVNYAMADGSVRLIRDGIDHNTFRRLVWKADGEVITTDY